MACFLFFFEILWRRKIIQDILFYLWYHYGRNFLNISHLWAYYSSLFVCNSSEHFFIYSPKIYFYLSLYFFILFWISWGFVTVKRVLNYLLFRFSYFINTLSSFLSFLNFVILLLKIFGMIYYLINKWRSGFYLCFVIYTSR